MNTKSLSKESDVTKNERKSILDLCREQREYGLYLITELLRVETFLEKRLKEIGEFINVDDDERVALEKELISGSFKFLAEDFSNCFETIGYAYDLVLSEKSRNDILDRYKYIEKDSDNGFTFHESFEEIPDEDEDEEEGLCIGKIISNIFDNIDKGEFVEDISLTSVAMALSEVAGNISSNIADHRFISAISKDKAISLILNGLFLFFRHCYDQGVLNQKAMAEMLRDELNKLSDKVFDADMTIFRKMLRGLGLNRKAGGEDE